MFFVRISALKNLKKIFSILESKLHERVAVHKQCLIWLHCTVLNSLWAGRKNITNCTALIIPGMEHRQICCVHQFFMEMSSFFSNYFLVSFFSSRSPLPPRKATSIVYRKPSLAVMGQLQFLNYHITLFGGSFQPVQMSNFLCITIAIFITILYNLSFVGESPKTHGNH